jgi:hypothetical protein
MKTALHSALFFALLTGALLQAATVTGTVTDKTVNKPAVGDTVVLVDVQSGMGEVAKAVTDANGHYSIKEPGNGPYLVRVTHQGGTYFIAAPEGNAPGDIPVYDVAANVGNVSIEADVLEIESDSGQLKITERYFVHNTSSPPRMQYDAAHGFQVTLPPDAVVDGTAARRPTGLPTSTTLKPAGGKGHFMFDFPIQPDEGDKDTLFQLSYHVPYSGKYTFKPQLALPSDNLAVLLPKAMTFAGGSGVSFQSVPQDPNVQTFLTKNVTPGKAIEFTISGTGSMPREAQGAAPNSPQAGSDAGASDTATPARPGGGIGEPINTPDPLTKYKWWILGGLALLFVVAAAFLLRRPSGTPISTANATSTGPIYGSPAAKNAALLGVLKEELFTLESEKLSGTITANDYQEQKAALEIVLKRALKHNS